MSTQESGEVTAASLPALGWSKEEIRQTFGSSLLPSLVLLNWSNVFVRARIPGL